LYACTVDYVVISLGVFFHTVEIVFSPSNAGSVLHYIKKKGLEPVTTNATHPTSYMVEIISVIGFGGSGGVCVWGGGRGGR
jgi:hypothetical protein